MSTLHIVPYIENEELIYMELKTDLQSSAYILLASESEQPGTIMVEAGNSAVKEEFLSAHYRYAIDKTVDEKVIFDADYYLHTIIPECATYLGCEQIKFPK